MLALAKWVQNQIQEDLKQFLKDGMPRKILVFSSFVSEAANELRWAMEKAAKSAWHEVRQSSKWREMAAKAAGNLDGLKVNVSAMLDEVSAMRRMFGTGVRVVCALKDPVESVVV